MGKGKKKKANKEKMMDAGKKTKDETGVGDSSTEQITMSREQFERARLAAANRTEDPLKNWIRIQNEDCPICLLPLPHEPSCTNYCINCGKTVCKGCVFGTVEAHMSDGGDAEKAMEKAASCPYCRSDTTSCDDKNALKALMKRANAGNDEAMYLIGSYYFKGKMGLCQDKAEGLKWYRRAVEAGSGKAARNIGTLKPDAGSGNAAYFLGDCYWQGDGVEQDHDKAFEYFQTAAELGHVYAFLVTGTMLMQRGEIEEGMLNYRKAAISGMSGDSLFNALRNGFRDGIITKDEYAFTLREHQKACNEMKSDGRELYFKLRSGP